MGPVGLEIAKVFHDFQLLFVLENRAPNRPAIEHLVLPSCFERCDGVNLFQIVNVEIDLSEFSNVVDELVNVVAHLKFSLFKARRVFVEFDSFEPQAASFVGVENRIIGINNNRFGLVFST